MRESDLIKVFSEIYNRYPSVIAKAPGRVNLIGEHTDYNDGFVLPIAIDRYTNMLVSGREDRNVRLYDLKYREGDEFNLDSVEHTELHRWSNYQRGIAKVLMDKGYEIGGMDVVICGEVPEGAGLSSSASVEIATLLSFKELYGIDIEPLDIIKLARKTENEFVGVECGIMDQFASLLSKEKFALFIDCRTLDYRYVRVSLPGCAFLVCNSMVKRELAVSAYNERRRECREAVEAMKKYLPHIESLRDITAEDIKKFGSYLPEVLKKRAEHVVYENERVKKAVEELEYGNMEAFGDLMNQSHRSLSELYEVSSGELDLLVETGREVEGVLGARLTGAGFGGCVIFFLKESSLKPLKEKVLRVYQNKTSLIPQFYEVTPSRGAFSEEISA
ncbi:galactokinase [candidate division WOR-3 bacterium JGI_Cruoil_03_44_89]|uniref:Galactokinase n=1 Tax=candidate division WOR-3 bacterium JGI_Cruoil_03_44_89 TaxID=1973748 RepID=A0A235BT39_UNCW3|nr:MAG: galactokinase [candidate division WOR-3 bacterium JGI_Cruoil_03_44_89]